MPCIEINRDIFKKMSRRLSNEQIGRVIKNIFLSIEDYNTCEEMSEVEGIYYELLVGYAVRKAEAWVNKTSNFRNNNPSKKE